MSKYDLKSIVPSVDIKDMLRSHIVRRSSESLKASAVLRSQELEAGRFVDFKNRILSSIDDYYFAMPVGVNAPKPQVKLVSTYEKNGYKLENVLFDSFSGWEVNATVYVPLNFEPPFPAVIVPVGHSGKQFDNYQFPCQYFARCGFLTISFDPPGQSSEKQEGNDHFVDGVRCYIVGETSSQYFIADAIRCIDYLETRNDVDMSNGVAMTGVSGGGTTTITAGLLDDRITVVGPSCCLSPDSELFLEQCYCNCPETQMFARHGRGIDDVDLACAMAPKPMLIMTGEFDEVFNLDDAKTLSIEVEKSYKSAGTPNAYEFYVCPNGHCYSIDQVQVFVKFMDKHYLKRQLDQTRTWPQEELILDPYEDIQCHPRLDVNMRTLTLDRAKHLAQNREVSSEKIASSILKLANIDSEVSIPESIKSRPFLMWHYWYQQFIIKPEEGIEIPATYIAPEDEHAVTVVHFDDTGRNTLLQRYGLLARLSGYVADDVRRCGVISFDLRGWGDSASCMYPYDMAPWAGIDRSLAYASVALGDSVMGMRIRDGLSAVAFVKNTEETKGRKVIVSGRGLGGVVALHVAAADPDVAGVVAWDSLVGFMSLLEEKQYTWPADTFFPNVLLYQDIPELVECLNRPVKIINPLDGVEQALKSDAIKELNRKTGNDTYSIGSDEDVINAFYEVMDSI